MLKQSKYFKIKVTVPVDSADKIKDVLGKAGAGRLGNYDFCSYSYPVSGQFRPLEGSNPTIGEISKIEKVEEMSIECVCHEDILKEVISKLRRAHPYEEPAIDIIPRLDIE